MTKTHHLRNMRGVSAMQKTQSALLPERAQALEDLLDACRLLKTRPHDAEMRIIERVEELDRMAGGPVKARAVVSKVVRKQGWNWLGLGAALGYAACMVLPVAVVLMAVFG